MITKSYHKFRQHFKKAIYFYSRPWLIIGLNIVLSALILIFYEPFGYHFDSWAEFTQLIGFSVIVFFYSVLFFLCIPQYPRIKSWMAHWTVGKNCLYSLLFLLVTGLSISFYDFHLIMQLNAGDYGSRAFYICLLTDTVGTFTIGIVPLCVGLLLEHSHQLKLNLEEIRKQHDQELQNMKTSTEPVDESNTDHHTPETNETTTDSVQTILLTGDTKENLEVAPQQILFLEASGNYVNVYYQNGEQSRKIIRSTFKSMEEQLANYPFLIRCHRTYIVNINYVRQLDRNVQGYRLFLQNYAKEIPVSRTYLKELKELLHL